MRIWDVPRLYRRAILIYVVTIVAPACGLVWLGLQSFQRQRQALTTLTAEKLSAELEAALRTAAEEALARHSHPVARTFFTMEQGTVTRPPLYAPPPVPVPREFLEAERQELEMNRPDLALETYRKLLAAHPHESLALSRVARCLTKLGRQEEARAAWRTLATTYPDERDPFHRPYGIVGAIESGDTAGLYDQIAAGRWDLSADQAEFFLGQLDPRRATPYLEQFRFARELSEQFRPQSVLHEGEIYSYSFGAWRIFYRSEPGDVLSGFAVNQDWLNENLKPQIANALGIADTSGQDLRIYGGAIALVLVILSAGVALLLRDISREARTNRLRSDFVSSVSHELKTPITLIRLYSETLLRPDAFREEDRDGFYRIIMRESERLGRLVDRILTFSRVERGDQVYTFEEGDVAPVIARVVEDYREYLERAGFRLEQALTPSAPPVRFDSGALSQAVVNLLDNAVKYSGENRDIAVRLDAHNGHVTFEVEDHGLGVAPAEQERIFRRFYRVSNGSGKGGYGLGLFLVRHIMDAHGGRIEVDSEPGRGSRFRLLFPRVSG
ncbi:MAG TPA: HAMP domain-containing sensor histidine kinase [Bryobacteraceae bacterium]|nr:HAMP domain-containing sensor histidine kinase [Bryobacteraceae bacterium]